MVRLALVLACVGAACSCGPSAGEEPRLREAPAKTTEVARVNGAPIDLAQVRELAAREQIAPREALSRLVDEQLLAQRAGELGYGDSPALVRALKRARVRALLAQAVEEGSEPSDIAARTRRLEALLTELAAQGTPKYDEATIARALREPLP